jgi:hypothetical protein
MTRQIWNLTLFLTLSMPLMAQKTIKRSVFFETNQAQLTETNFNYLKSLSDTLKRYNDYAIQLKGNTDADGSDKANKILSEKRVAEVRKALESHGIPYSYFSTEALGENKPEADNTSTEGKKRNRRVDIFITFSPKTIAAQPTSKQYQNVQQLYEDIKTPPQYFKLKTGRDTVIKGEKGTVLFIPKDAFAGIPTNAVVDFKLKEAYNLLDMVSENLNTQSNGKVLQTGGMFNAEATFNSKPLTLKKDLKVTFPTPESQLDGMQLFTGARNEQQNGRMNWTPVNATNDRTDSFTDEKELIIYSQNGKFDPFLLMNGEGVLTFKEIIDTTRCLPLLTKQQLDQAQTTGKEVKIDRLSNTGFALSLYNYYNPTKNRRTLVDLHKAAFSEMYEFYKVKTLAELKQQRGQSWDSLMQVRLNFIKEAKLAQERMMARQDSMQKEFEVYSAAYKKFLDEQTKFRNSFNMPKLGWINCDRFTQSTSTMPNFTTNLISDKSNVFDVKKPFEYVFDVFLYMKQEVGLLNYNTIKDDKITFFNIPKNKNAILFAMKVENGQPYLAFHDIKTDKPHYDLDFKPVSAEEIKVKFQSLK